MNKEHRQCKNPIPLPSVVRLCKGGGGGGQFPVPMFTMWPYSIKFFLPLTFFFLCTVFAWQTAFPPFSVAFLPFSTMFSILSKTNQNVWVTCIYISYFLKCFQFGCVQIFFVRLRVPLALFTFGHYCAFKQINTVKPLLTTTLKIQPTRY